MSSDLSAEGYRKQDSSLGGLEANPESQIPAPKVPGSKHSTQNHPQRPGCARSREIGGRVHSLAKQTKGYITKETLFLAFLNPERVKRQGGQNQLYERLPENVVFRKEFVRETKGEIPPQIFRNCGHLRLAQRTSPKMPRTTRRYVPEKIYLHQAKNNQEGTTIRSLVMYFLKNIP